MSFYHRIRIIALAFNQVKACIFAPCHKETGCYNNMYLINAPPEMN